MQLGNLFELCNEGLSGGILNLRQRCRRDYFACFILVLLKCSTEIILPEKQLASLHVCSISLKCAEIFEKNKLSSAADVDLARD